MGPSQPENGKKPLTNLLQLEHKKTTEPNSVSLNSLITGVITQCSEDSIIIQLIAKQKERICSPETLKATLQA